MVSRFQEPDIRMKGMGQMDIEKILLKYDEMIARESCRLPPDTLKEGGPVR